MNNRKLLILLLFAKFSACKDIALVTHQTTLIYQRFYLIKRLQQAQEVLLHSNLEPQVLERLDQDYFRTPQICAVIQEIHEQKTLDPMVTLWREFASYQHIYDVSFTDEYIKLLCSFYLLHEHYPIRTCMSDREWQLAFLDAAADGVLHHQIYRFKNNETHVVTVDHIAQRYFVLKRLNKSMSFLAAMQRNDTQPFIRKVTRAVMIDYTEEIKEDMRYFTHNRIKECLYALCKEKTLDPLLRVCAECKQYRYAADDHFLQEMLMSMFLMYKYLLLKNVSIQNEQVILSEMNQILETYENFDALTLDEILEAIDVATDALIAVQSMHTDYSKKDGLLALSGVALCVLIGIQIVHYLKLR